MVKLNVNKLLREQGKTKSWLCEQMGISLYNLNKALEPGRKSLSYKYIEGFCKHLNCTFDQLISIEPDEDQASC